MARVVLYPAKLEAILHQPECKAHMLKVGEKIVGYAKAIFISQRVLEGHNDYVSSFVVEPEGKSVLVGNTDDTSFWVEFGAHAGGKTAVLGYAPLRRAIDVASA